jgi:hypothetical protein
VEGSAWEDLRSTAEQRLMIWITATKCVEADGLIAEIDLTANQTMRPQSFDLKGMSKQADRAGFGGATYEDYHSLG